MEILQFEALKCAFWLIYIEKKMILLFALSIRYNNQFDLNLNEAFHAHSMKHKTLALHDQIFATIF